MSALDIVNKRYEKLIAHWDPKSPVSEAYRTLRTNIQFAGVDQEIKTILVTSTAPEEGKSTTSANLAVVMAQAGKRTLFIDADLRKPTGHQTFYVSNRRGLTSFLVGQAAWEDAMQQTGIDNLFVMTAGPIPPNPSELLASKRMQAAMEELRGQFDAIILDTPPALAVADAAILARMADGCILVVNAGKTNRDMAKRAKQQLEHAHARLLGVVLNNKKLKKKEDYYYYYQK
ncbi:CpsD/CapB family tyrosine-protein kinase [Aneurinibacillus sp. BA2021]|nr:CpsD/CapB family tyrosine-protein kinase [Aneurinibacillus sp. BA2021]